MGRIGGFGLRGTSLQLKPGSTLHFDEQPSPSTVLPSSQSWPLTLSIGSRRPSPQTVAQAPPVGGQTGSRRQKGEQPSPVAVLPSSHCSEPSLSLFPHVVVAQIVGPAQPFAPFGDVQAQPSACATGLLSRVQIALQPSPATVLPSSHWSLPATLPSPHLAARQAATREHWQPHSSWP